MARKFRFQVLGIVLFIFSLGASSSEAQTGVKTLKKPVIQIYVRVENTILNVIEHHYANLDLGELRGAGGAQQYSCFIKNEYGMLLVEVGRYKLRRGFLRERVSHYFYVQYLAGDVYSRDNYVFSNLGKTLDNESGGSASLSSQNYNFLVYIDYTKQVVVPDPHDKAVNCSVR